MAAGPGRNMAALSVMLQAGSQGRPCSSPRAHSGRHRKWIRPWCGWCRVTRPPWTSRTRKRFAEVVKAAFGQRRKTPRNRLNGVIDEAGFAAAGAQRCTC